MRQTMQAATTLLLCFGLLLWPVALGETPAATAGDGGDDTTIVYRSDTAFTSNWGTSRPLSGQLFELFTEEALWNRRKGRLPRRLVDAKGDEISSVLNDPNKAAIVAYLGEAPTGGYAVRIREVVVREATEATTPGVVTITIGRRRPGPSDFVIQAFTYPYDIVSIDKTSLPAEPFDVIFVDEAGNTLAEGARSVFSGFMPRPPRDRPSPPRPPGEPITTVPRPPDSTPSPVDDGTDTETSFQGLLQTTGYGHVSVPADNIAVTWQLRYPHRDVRAATGVINAFLRDVSTPSNRVGLPVNASVRPGKVIVRPGTISTGISGDGAGFYAEASLFVHVTNERETREVIDAILHAAGDVDGLQAGITSVQYDVDDEEAVYAQAFAAAVADAQARAAAVTAALGTAPPRPVSAEDESGPILPLRNEIGLAAETHSTFAQSIDPEDVIDLHFTVETTVTITFIATPASHVP